MWDRWLQSIEAVVKREQGVASKRHDGRLLGLCQNRRTWFLWTCFEIIDCLAFAPLCDRLGIDPQLTAQRRERSLRSFGPALGPMADQPSSLKLWRRGWSWRFRDEPGP